MKAAKISVNTMELRLEVPYDPHDPDVYITQIGVDFAIDSGRATIQLMDVNGETADVSAADLVAIARDLKKIEEALKPFAIKGG